jgi:hypothetical protein
MKRVERRDPFIVVRKGNLHQLWYHCASLWRSEAYRMLHIYLFYPQFAMTFEVTFKTSTTHTSRQRASLTSTPVIDSMHKGPNICALC